MKKLLSVVCGVGLAFGAVADEHTGLPWGQEEIEDRNNGTYRIECAGYRQDKGDTMDWNIGKQQMTYVAYGINSHELIGFLNAGFGRGANAEREALGLPPIYEE